MTRTSKSRSRVQLVFFCIFNIFTFLEIIQWLKEIDLEQYTHLFLKEELYKDTLSELSDALLEKLGVSVAGHRMKILKASRDPNMSPGSTNYAPIVKSQTSSSSSSPSSRPTTPLMMGYLDDDVPQERNPEPEIKVNTGWRKGI